MKRLTCLGIACTLMLFLVACGGISTDKYDEVSSYVTENAETLKPDVSTEFFTYKTDGTLSGTVYYGYYYNDKNEIMLPDFYNGNDLEVIQGDIYEADGGVYFGKPDNGTDWCYIKMIDENWYYYELHWA